MKYIWLIIALFFFIKGIWTIIVANSGGMYALMMVPQDNTVGWYFGYVGGHFLFAIIFGWLFWRGFKKKKLKD